MEGLRERLIGRTLLVVACSVIIMLAIITYFIFQAGLPLIVRLGLDDFLFNPHWMPAEKGGSFGIGAMVLGSLWVTLGALIVGVPLGLAVAVFSAELAPEWLSTVIRPAIQLLAGIPSVIYGFVGLTVLVPWVRAHLGGPGLSVLTAAVVLGIMILPNIISISEDALRAVPPAYREGALALGSTRWQMIWRVLIPAARSGIAASVILGMGRALGETMAVIMMIGNSLQVPRSLLDPATTMTSNIGLEMAYASGEHREALFATGVVLFVFIMVLNLAANTVSRRRVKS
ncbi:MAG TPA: phosphate ABC transporter permease subunit PstC [Armatimonadota bacterium]|nr:phosphate ABC transporter permease subunit PstC [Armatimonadota bacterium]HOM81863.1 phosphate ABC transporter permease subunit PstC [Armatimonadota bacterium]HOQ27704.1 phosphate ABC transporter permease subunit PstC [Armatimonadota bacterium]HPO74463.1 phosphate ABC transporter permease subunit PstC [Armatimonadota bacterium]HPT99584.1 phosphate ABC transporter permease subunit PstC [Armatimonadota bacterium]